MTHDPQETLDAAVEAACHLVLQAQRDLHEWLEAKGYAEGYAAALDAAREAVKHLQHSDDCYYAEGVLCHCEIKRAITAIDALKEKR